MQAMVDNVAEKIIGVLAERQQTLCTVESCTGGMLAAAFTAVAGCSRVLMQGFIPYSNDAKIQTLQVPEAILAQYGAVSEQTAHALAENGRRIAGTDYALAVTGIAGPSGGSAHKPVGTVYMAIADKQGVKVHYRLFGGTRQAICKQTIATLHDIFMAVLQEGNN
jgi:PncC family amidohydrolase